MADRCRVPAVEWSGDSYPNVGWMHLWGGLEHVAFEGPAGEHPRVAGDGGPWVDAAAPSFARDVERMATAAARRVVGLRTLHGAGRDALARIASVRSEKPFDLLDAGIASALLEREDASPTLHRAAERAGALDTSAAEVVAAAGQVIDLRRDTGELVAWLDARIARSRQALKLERFGPDDLVRAWELGS
ncbi:MAG TPA: hypothetical protein VF230_15640 [Acidimicrobiales bacterium]